MKLAIFDLDHTLMPMDTGDAWVRFLVRESGIDAMPVFAQLDRFASEYHAQTLSIEEFEDFQMRFLARFPRGQLDAWRDKFVREWVLAHVPQRSVQLVAKHTVAGDVTALCSATYSYVTEPIAALFGIDEVLCTRPATDAAGTFLGYLAAPPTYREGKVHKVRDFVRAQAKRGVVFEELVFYSDSLADMPLFEFVADNGGRCVAVNPSAALEEVARARAWPCMATFDKSDLERANAVTNG